jgi:hypothetical protein
VRELPVWQHSPQEPLGDPQQLLGIIDQKRQREQFEDLGGLNTETEDSGGQNQ